MNYLQLLNDSDPQSIKARLSLASVVRFNGVELRPEGDRLVGICPFHDDHDASFAVWSPEDGVELCGCWSCDFKPGDVFDFIMRAHTLGFSKAVQVALGYIRDVLPAGPDIPERDPNAPRPDYSAVIREARLRPLGQLHELLTTKDIAAPADWVAAEFRVGAGDQGEIVIPHIGLDGEIRGAKWRTIDRKPMSMPGTRLDALYGAWRDKGSNTVVLCEGESDTWAVAWLLREDDCDVLGLPSGVSSRVREEWVDQLRGRSVTLLFDADEAGRRGAVGWTSALNGVADAVRVASLPDGDDAVSAGESAVRSAVAEAWRFVDPAGLAITRGGGRYVRVNPTTGAVNILSDFTLDVERLVVSSDGAVFEVTTEMLSGPQQLTSSELGNQQRMREWMASRLLSWKGGARDVADLLETLKAEALFVPRVRGTSVIGLHDETFVLPDCTIGSPGWGYIPPPADVSLGATLKLCAGGDWDHRVPFALAQLHASDVITPILGWVAAAPLRSICAQFPTLAVVGGAGWGKTTLIETVLRSFGFWTSAPMTLTSTTKHGVQSYAAATNAFPVWFDEYRHGANPDTKLAVDQLIRDAWDGSSSVKGGYGEDKVAIRRLAARAPMLITGEDAFSEASHAERMVLVSIPMEGKNPEALDYLRTANVAGFGRSYLEWLSRAMKRGDLPAPPMRQTRMELTRATAAWGWDLLRHFTREATGADLPDFDDTRILAEHTALKDSPLIIEALKDAYGRRSVDGYEMVWQDGDDICVRVIDFVRWVKRETDHTLPGGTASVTRWLDERWDTIHHRNGSVRYIQLLGASSVIA